MLGQAYMAALHRRLAQAQALAVQRTAERARQLAAEQSAALAESIEVQDNTVTATAPFAAAVELGTARRAARPFLRPALLELVGGFAELLEQTAREDRA